MQDLKNLNYLLPKTREILCTLEKKCEFLHKFVLVGGSALSLYLCHRLSEDLDFFTYDDNFDMEEVLSFCQNYENINIINHSLDQIDIIFDGVKITFFNAKWDILKPNKPKNLNISNMETIASLKANVLFLRAKYRDYYDIYFLVKKMGLKKVFSCAQNRIEGINFKLFTGSLLYIDDIEDDEIEHLKPIKKLTKTQIRDFFQKEISKLS